MGWWAAGKSATTRRCTSTCGRPTSIPTDSTAHRSVRLWPPEGRGRSRRLPRCACRSWSTARRNRWTTTPRWALASKQELVEQYAHNFYFGCEADDPCNVWAFDARMPARLKAMLGTDVGHWDVTDFADVLPETWEMVEDELISERDFRELTFSQRGRAAHAHESRLLQRHSRRGGRRTRAGDYETGGEVRVSDPTIIYTHTDEAPALATYSLLPIVRAYAAKAGVDVETPRHLAGRADHRQLPRTPRSQTSASATRWPSSASWPRRPKPTSSSCPTSPPPFRSSRPPSPSSSSRAMRVPDYPDEPKSDAEREILEAL